jgi:hypothetical protein
MTQKVGDWGIGLANCDSNTANTLQPEFNGNGIPSWGGNLVTGLPWVSGIQGC